MAARRDGVAVCWRRGVTVGKQDNGEKEGCPWQRRGRGWRQRSSGTATWWRTAAVSVGNRARKKPPSHNERCQGCNYSFEERADGSGECRFHVRIAVFR
jgi:hypothetical protein